MSDEPKKGRLQQRAEELKAQQAAKSAVQKAPVPAGGGTSKSGTAAADPSLDSTETGPVGQGEYVVRAGDCTASIAYDHGHFWETLWNDPANEELKSVRKDPYVLFPEDRMTIAQKERKDESGETEMRHRFVRWGAPEKLIIYFRTNGVARSNQEYELNIDGKLSPGVTDPNGRVEIFIPPNARKGMLTFVESGDSFDLALGHLCPITELLGVQQRLKNLGFYKGPLDGKPSKVLEEGIRSFQSRSNLRVTGEFDDETRQALEAQHGS